jgi:hypothetical protein
MRYARCIVLASVAVATSAAAQQSKPDSTRVRAAAHGAVRAAILGVFDEQTGAPIPDATVADMVTGDHAQTTATGTVSLWFVKGGGSVVQVHKLGYEPWAAVVDPRDTTPITVVLRQITSLAPVVSRAKFQITSDRGLRDGIDARCQPGNHVTCFRDDELAQYPTHLISDFLLEAPGVSHPICGQKQPPAAGPKNVCGYVMHNLAPSGSHYCTPTYYVDGIIWQPNIGLPLENNGFTTTNTATIEVYDSGIPRPVRFSGGNPFCGAIVLWTK